ncbi:MAG: M48 family metallopeptidase [Thermoleophilaceae bacterium]|nr:M48 family metallopeptidase [Thermoleophilaceae bacterium]
MYKQIAVNKRKSWFLMSGFLLIYAVIAYAMYLWVGPVGAFGIAALAFVMVLISLFGGDDMAVLAAGGKQIKSKSEAPELWRMVENLSITAGLPMPRLYISPDPSPNAFAAGRNQDQALICVNKGLLDVLDDQELYGVLAHEMAHIKNLDVKLMTYVAVLAGSIALIAQIISYGLWFGGSNRDSGGGWLGLVVVLLTIILAPIAATIIQLSISRKREYVADASGAELTRYPQGLASALNQISGNMVATERPEEAIAHMMIAPSMNARGKESTLFATHPATEDRVGRLTEMAGGISHRHDRPVGSYFTLPWAAGDGSTGGDAPQMQQDRNFVPLAPESLNTASILKAEQAAASSSTSLQ